MSRRRDPFSSIGPAFWMFLALALLQSHPTAFSAADKIDFPERKFSVPVPPADWEVTGRSPSAASWTNGITKSVISVSAGELSPHSYPGLAQIFLSNTWMALQHRSQGKWSWKVNPAEQKEVALNGKTFYQLIATIEGSSKEAGQAVASKILLYLLKTDKFEYSFSMTALSQYYEADRHVMESMARGFSLVE